MRKTIGQPVELDQLEKRVHFLADHRVGQALPARADAQAEGNVFEDGHVAEQRIVLEHEPHLPVARMRIGRILAVKSHRARIRSLQPGDDPQQRCLSGTGGAEQR